MSKKNLIKSILSTVAILLTLPIMFIVDRFSVGHMPSVAGGFAVIIPIMAVLNIIMLLLTIKEYEKRDMGDKVINLVFILMPLINAFVCSMMISVCLGQKPSISVMKFFIAGLFGLLFLILGNYTPKVRQNSTFGVKIKWTLENEENWNATHRFSGKVMVAAGALIIVFAFLPIGVYFIFFTAVVFVTVISSIIYSYLYYKKQMSEGHYEVSAYNSVTFDKKTTKVAGVITAVAVVIVALMLFTGKLSFTIGEESLEIKPSLGGGTEIKYSDIDSIEYRNDSVPGTRISGVGSAKLLYGWFNNEEFGSYVRYTYTNSNCAIVIIVDGEEYVISDVDAESTKAMYDEILKRMGD